MQQSSVDIETKVTNNLNSHVWAIYSFKEKEMQTVQKQMVSSRHSVIHHIAQFKAEMMKCE